MGSHEEHLLSRCQRLATLSDAVANQGLQQLWDLLTEDLPRLNLHDVPATDPKTEKNRTAEDSSAQAPSQSCAELLLSGESKDEIVFSSVCKRVTGELCYGSALLAELALYLQILPQRRYSYRMLFVPEHQDIRSYLGNCLEKAPGIAVAAFYLTCQNTESDCSYLPSPDADTLSDRVLQNALRFHFPRYRRQNTRNIPQRAKSSVSERALPLCGLALNALCLAGEQSAEKITTVQARTLQEYFLLLQSCVYCLEHNYRYEVTCLGEPQLSKRGLYPKVAKKEVYDESVKTMMHLITYSDGSNDLIALSERLKTPAQELVPMIEQLLKADELRRCN